MLILCHKEDYGYHRTMYPIINMKPMIKITKTNREMVLLCQLSMLVHQVLVISQIVTSALKTSQKFLP